jgi:hypothetical protein
MRSWPNINYYHGICLEGLKKDLANLNLHCYRSYYLYNTILLALLEQRENAHQVLKAQTWHRVQ